MCGCGHQLQGLARRLRACATFDLLVVLCDDLWRFTRAIRNSVASSFSLCNQVDDSPIKTSPSMIRDLAAAAGAHGALEDSTIARAATEADDPPLAVGLDICNWSQLPPAVCN